MAGCRMVRHGTSDTERPTRDETERPADSLRQSAGNYQRFRPSTLRCCCRSGKFSNLASSGLLALKQFVRSVSNAKGYPVAVSFAGQLLANGRIDLEEIGYH